MNEPTYDPRILELLEVCRRDHAEQGEPLRAELVAALKDDPQLEQLWQRVQQIDARLSAALHDVSAPEGLAERILERLAARQSALAVSISGGNVAGVEAAAPGRFVDSRRRKLLAVAGTALVAVAASLFLAVWLASPVPETFSAGQMLHLAIARFNYEHDFAGLFESRPLADAPEQYPLSAFVAPEGQVRWRPLGATSQDAPQFPWEGVAYDLHGSQGVLATLYVLRATVASLPDIPPASPTLTTGMCSAAIWQENGLVYVLVVRGGTDEYRQFVQTRPGPIA